MRYLRLKRALLKQLAGGLMAALTMAAAPLIMAQEVMPGMDHDAMHGGMNMSAPKTPASAKQQPPSVTEMERLNAGQIIGVRPITRGLGTGGMGRMQGRDMSSMQGGSAPSGARSPDYSDGYRYQSLRGLGRTVFHNDNPLLGRLLIDQLEYVDGKEAKGLTWEGQGWYGNNTDKLWVRTEGERSSGRRGNIEVFWNRNVTAFWSTQLGTRYDIGDGPGRPWVAFGIQGLAPYWFELEATAYINPASGRTAARFFAEYELLFTQRLILQPEAEFNLYGKDDPARHISSGVSDVEFGLRLRYEIRRQFAPYVGVVWSRRFGGYAALKDRPPFLNQQFVAGLRIWF
jgi:copper resistance protein B